MKKAPEQNMIGVDTIPALWACQYALAYDRDPVAPTAQFREQLKRVVLAAEARKLFTWYERLGVKLLTIRKG